MSSFRVPGKRVVRNTVATTADLTEQRFAAVVYRRLLFSLLLAPALSPAGGLPRVASINLCSDQLLLELADPEQIATVSWLAADPEDSLLAERARAFPLNYGSAEEILAHDPDVVLGGSFTNAFTRALLARLGVRVVALDPANSVAEIARNLSVVAEAIGQTGRGRRQIERMLATAQAIRTSSSGHRVTALVVRPGGYTVGAGSLADELMSLAGLDNLAAVGGLDRWGSLSIEALLTSRAELLIFTGYRHAEASLANEVLRHPVLTGVRSRTTHVEIDARYWACGTPQSLRSAELLAAAARQASR